MPKLTSNGPTVFSICLQQMPQNSCFLTYRLFSSTISQKSFFWSISNGFFVRNQLTKPGTVVNTFNPLYLGIDTKGSGVQKQPQLHSKFKVNLGRLKKN